MEHNASIGKNSTLTRNIGLQQSFISSKENSFKKEKAFKIGTRHGVIEDTNSGDAQSFEFESPDTGGI